MKKEEKQPDEPVKNPPESPITYLPARSLPELICDREAIRAALKESRKRHTVRVRSHLP